MTIAAKSHRRSDWHSNMPSTPEVAPWVERLGRIGHWAKGIVYLVVGGLAFQLAIGAGGQITGARGAIREIGHQPFGRTLLGLMAIGLVGYTAWRWVQAAKDTEGVGSDAKGIAMRIAFVISGAVYLLLGFFAGTISATGVSSSGQGGGGSSFLLNSMPARIGLAGVGAVLIGLAFFFMYQAYRATFMRHFAIGSMSEKTWQVALHVGRVGLATRGIAFAIVGWFILWSAINGTSDGEISGLHDALAAIAAQAYGKVLLGIAGAGLICFGVHTVMMGIYRRFNVTSGS